MRLEAMSVVAGELSVGLIRSASPLARTGGVVGCSGISAQESKRVVKDVGCSRGAMTGEGWGVGCTTATDRKEEVDAFAAATSHS